MGVPGIRSAREFITWGHTFVNAIKRGHGNVKCRHAMNINKRMVAYSNHDRCCVAALLIDSASSKLASLAVA